MEVQVTTADWPQTTRFSELCITAPEKAPEVSHAHRDCTKTPVVINMIVCTKQGQSIMSQDCYAPCCSSFQSMPTCLVPSPKANGMLPWVSIFQTECIMMSLNSMSLRRNFSRLFADPAFLLCLRCATGDSACPSTIAVGQLLLHQQQVHKN